MPAFKATSDRQNIFFSGIAGSGVSALALFMALKGHNVSGSDRQFDSGSGMDMKNSLEAAGIAITPQDGSGITQGLDLMVMSTAVEADRPEVLRARELGLSIMTRPEFLVSLSSGYKSIAVAGTSGKSTASGMLAFALDRLGAAPNYISGGKVKDFRTPQNPGNVLSGDADWLVMEADESDGSIVNYTPYCSVIANLSLDHNPVDETATMFRQLVMNTSGRVILNADEQKLMGLGADKALSYSVNNPSADLRAEDITMEGLNCAFSIKGQAFNLNQPGLHNIYNALAAISVLHFMEFGLDRISEAIAPFKGIERRFDVHLEKDGLMVIDDYAHNPHKIGALMRTISGISDRACYIFQPHGFGPLKLMLNEYADTFKSHLREQDMLFILPVYYSGGTAKCDIGPRDLAALCGATPLEDRDSLISFISNVQPYDCYAVLGARDDSLRILAGEIAGKLGKNK